ncbi:MAG: protein kinase [Pirellulaceae bacterium]|nr:protein kinase [Pirellulaceae bacterium]
MPPLLSTVKHRDDGTEMAAASRLAVEAKQRWSRGETPDVARLLDEHPELKVHKSIVLDLAHEEFARRVEAGESLNTDEFCRRFPTLHNSLCMLIEVNRLLKEDPRFQSLGKEPEWPEPGDSFLGYSLLAELGHGSFARVFLASEPALGGRLVALKVSPRGENEAEVVGKLRHPNIVPVHSVTEDPATGLTAICEPYLGRATLCDLLDRVFVDGEAPREARVIGETIVAMRLDTENGEQSPLPRSCRRGSYVDGILQLVLQIAEALDYTHARGICHRDLKPSNVLLSNEGRPLLLDFNLSADGQINAWRMGGTLPYMSPEQLRMVATREVGTPPPPDPRSDLFSLGVIAHELLCGRLPFGPMPRHSTVEEIAAELLERQKTGPRSPREQNARVDRHIERLLRECLAFDPDDRPKSAKDLAESLRKQLSPTRRARRWARNHPRRVLAAGTAALAILVAGAAYWASLPTYPVRQYEMSVQLAARGEYDRAAEHLDRAIDADPNNPELLFARGRLRQKQGEWDLATIAFRTARKIRDDGRFRAAEGYCANMTGNNTLAESRYRAAIESGFKSAAVLNNLGYSLIRTSNHAAAESVLIEAIELDPGLQAARNNRLMLHAQLVSYGQPVTEAMLGDARRAVATAPASGELYLTAAILFTRAGKDDPRWIPEAKEYWRLALANHISPMSLASLQANPNTSYLFDDAEMRELAERPASDSALPVKPVLLVDPIDDTR